MKIKTIDPANIDMKKNYLKIPIPQEFEVEELMVKSPRRRSSRNNKHKRSSACNSSSESERAQKKSIGSASKFKQFASLMNKNEDI